MHASCEPRRRAVRRRCAARGNPGAHRHCGHLVRDDVRVARCRHRDSPGDHRLPRCDQQDVDHPHRPNGLDHRRHRLNDDPHPPRHAHRWRCVHPTAPSDEHRGRRANPHRVRDLARRHHCAHPPVDPHSCRRCHPARHPGHRAGSRQDDPHPAACRRRAVTIPPTRPPNGHWADRLPGVHRSGERWHLSAEGGDGQQTWPTILRPNGDEPNPTQSEPRPCRRRQRHQASCARKRRRAPPQTGRRSSVRKPAASYSPRGSLPKYHRR